MSYRLTMKCPKCERTSEITDDRKNPPVACGDCLFDRIEVVHMHVAKCVPVED